jgi:hypothetical protein
MQHDIVELLDFIKYAKENFGSDESAKHYFVRTERVDAFGKPYREDKVKFECVLILGWVTGTKIEIKVVGLNDDVQFQREFIAGVIDAHKKESA